MFLSAISLSWILLCFVGIGNALQCYTYQCTKYSNPAIPSQPCPQPKPVTCGTSVVGTAADRCMTQRFQMKMSMGGQVVVMNQEMRNCTSSMMCNRDDVCKIVNNSLSGRLEKCELGCCKGDLCNAGRIPIPAPKPTGPTGNALQCYTYQCTKYSNPALPSQPCPQPKPVTCGTSVFGTPADRCVTQRYQMKMSMGGQVVVMNQEMRNCTSSLMCNRDAVCKIANNSLSGMLEKCELGCCKGDLCNTGAIPTHGPKLTGPKGSDLSCYSCANFPFNTSGFSVAKTDCTNPVKQTCGPDMMPWLQQDRCMRIKVKMGGILGEMRNCSGMSFCNSDVFCKAVNQSGMITSCDVSCCHGNLCNSDDKAWTTPPSKGTTFPSIAINLRHGSQVLSSENIARNSSSNTSEKPIVYGSAVSLTVTMTCFLVLAARGLVVLADMI